MPLKSARERLREFSRVTFIPLPSPADDLTERLHQTSLKRSRSLRLPPMPEARALVVSHSEKARGMLLPPVGCALEPTKRQAVLPDGPPAVTVFKASRPSPKNPKFAYNRPMVNEAIARVDDNVQDGHYDAAWPSWSPYRRLPPTPLATPASADPDLRRWIEKGPVDAPRPSRAALGRPPPMIGGMMSPIMVVH